jgi:hypothetical protein
MPRPLYPQGKAPWYPWNRRLGVPQNRYGHGGEEKNFKPLLGIKHPIIQTVAQKINITRLLNLLQRKYSFHTN